MRDSPDMVNMPMYEYEYHVAKTVMGHRARPVGNTNKAKPVGATLSTVDLSKKRTLITHGRGTHVVRAGLPKQ